MFLPLLHRFVALLLACNYFAFQVEVFEEEYEANHRQVSEENAIAAPTLTWESFDKNNAPKAFVVHVTFAVAFLFQLAPPQPLSFPPLTQRSIVRDKSPPSPAPASV